MDTTTVDFTCPADGCRKTHTAVVTVEGHDRAETACSKCRNNVVVRTRDGRVVETEVL